MAKYAFVIYSDPEVRSELVKAMHAIQYAMALKRKGHEVLIFFDGLGTKVPLSQLRPLVEEATKMGLVYGACGYCAPPPPVNVSSRLREAGLKLLGDENDHKDLTLFHEIGYEVIMV